MTPKIIVSYDDTDNDRDAIALGRLLAVSGADLSLAYVRHQQADARDRESLEQRQAEELLANGAEAIGAPDTPRHVVVHASTGEGPDRAGRARAGRRGRVRIRVPDRGRLRGPRHLGAAAAERRPGRRRRSRRRGCARVPTRRSARIEDAGGIIATGDATGRRRRSPTRSAPKSCASDAGTVDLLVIASRPEAPAGA